MLTKFFVLVVIAVVSCVCEDIGKEPKTNSQNRQKRLLFFDEDGSLVKVSSGLGAAYGGLLAPFIAYFRPYSISVPTLALPVPVAAAAAAQLAGPLAHTLRGYGSGYGGGSVERNELCNGRRDQIPSAADCGEFLNCWDGWAFAQQCPAGLLFSEAGVCDYPRNVDCARRRSAAPELAGRKCVKDYEAFRGVSCRQFFVCVNGEPIAFECPAQLMYSQDLGICDYAYNVNCSGVVLPSYTSLLPLPALPSLPTLPTLPARITEPDKKSDVPTTTARSDASAPLKITVTKDSVRSSESWTAHVASSRKDAIRQLQLQRSEQRANN